MPKFKLTVTKDGETHVHEFDAKDKEAAELYGKNLASFGGFDLEDENTDVKVTAKR